MATYQYIGYATEEGSATITLNNPPANALSRAVLNEIKSALEEAEKDAKIKAIILTGTGVFFAAGADIKEISNLKTAQDAENAASEGQALLNKIEHLSIPVIAAINGFCLGGGNEIAMACHIRFASDRAKFGQPEINLGIIPGFGGTQRLPRIVGAPLAFEMLLTGDMISAQEAKAIGLINKIVPEAELMKQAKGLAKKIASKGKLAIGYIMEAAREGLKKPLLDGLKLEASLFGKVCQTQDMKEGLSAFLEKRQPKFTDK